MITNIKTMKSGEIKKNILIWNYMLQARPTEFRFSKKIKIASSDIDLWQLIFD